jgi:hypothetical protein
MSLRNTEKNKRIGTKGKKRERERERERCDVALLHRWIMDERWEERGREVKSHGPHGLSSFLSFILCAKKLIRIL